MTARRVAVLASANSDPLALAMLEDVVDLLEAMREVDGALALPAGAGDAARDVTWPGMPLLDVAADADVCAVLDAVGATGAGEGGVV